MIATADGWGRVTISHPDELSGAEAKFEAVKALLDKAVTYPPSNPPWRFVSGGLADGSEVFCFADCGEFCWYPKQVKQEAGSA